MKIIIECDNNIYSIFIIKLLDFLTKLQNIMKIRRRNKIKYYVRFDKYIIIMLIVIVMNNNRHNNE
jgi:hypothetical protein